jgi:hypothetical protein
MLVTNLEYMEKIVSERSDLEWSGWDIVKYTKSENAQFSVDGFFKNGSWFKKRTFPITEKGWNIPNSIGRNYEKVER